MATIRKAQTHRWNGPHGHNPIGDQRRIPDGTLPSDAAGLAALCRLGAEVLLNYATRLEHQAKSPGPANVGAVKAAAPTDQLLTAPEVADYLNISKTQAYYMIQARRIPHVRFGRLVRVKKADLEQWLVDQTVASE